MAFKFGQDRQGEEMDRFLWKHGILENGRPVNPTERDAALEPLTNAVFRLRAMDSTQRENYLNGLDPVLRYHLTGNR